MTLKAAGAAVLVVAGLLAARYGSRAPQAPIKVGVLHSLTGTRAISEAPVVDATLLAIEEINAAGGLLGRLVVPVVVDGESNWGTFAREAERLIRDEGVSAVFGCWTSACRKTVKPIFERYQHLLFYPVQYEGLEQSPNIVYLGATPNQQIIPGVKWAFDHLGKRFFLVGSDYVFPRTANALIRDQLTTLGGEIAGEEYLPLGSQEIEPLIQKIVAARPQVLINTLNGDSNLAFFRALRAAGLPSAQFPTMSFSIAESELKALDPKDVAGDYGTWSYFQSISTETNAGFVARFRARYGAERVMNDPMEAAYIAVKLWALAVSEAGTADVRLVRTAVLKQSLPAPEGIVSIDRGTQHAWKTVRVGRIRSDGQFDIVWTSQGPIRPEPYPPYHSRQEWEGFLVRLHDAWGGWESPRREARW